MSLTINTLLLVLAAVCFGLAAITGFTRNRPLSKLDLVALGLLFWVLSQLIH